MVIVFRLLLLLVFASPVFAGVIYVDADAQGAGNGSSWADAYNHLQDAIAISHIYPKPLEIKIAAGTYTPDKGADVISGDRQASFQLISGVTMKGGYAGFGQADPNERDIKSFETILSGDLSGDDISYFMGNDENSYHVVTASGTEVSAILDGITITAGYANSVFMSPDTYGGGVYINDGSSTFIDCQFKGNRAYLGGGIYSAGSPVLIRCAFHNNWADDGKSQGDGGGMYNEKKVTTTLVDCVFIDNSAAAMGGGIYNAEYSKATLTGCSFTGNTTAYGAGMINRSDTEVQVVKCTFSNNAAIWNGGGIHNNRTVMTLTNSLFLGNIANNGAGIYSHHKDIDIVNCVFHGNMARSYGGGVCSDNMENVSIIQSILWENTAGVEGSQIALIVNNTEHRFTTSIYYSNIQGGILDLYRLNSGISWDNNMEVNPEFAQPGYWDRGLWIEGDYHLKSEAGRWDPNSASWIQDGTTSPCVDAGDPNANWAEELWPHGERINIGAYGGTPQASMSLLPVGDAADLDNSGTIDMLDIAWLSTTWLAKQSLLYEDLNRDGCVNFIDFTVLADRWLLRE